MTQSPDVRRNEEIADRIAFDYHEENACICLYPDKGSRCLEIATSILKELDLKDQEREAELAEAGRAAREEILKTIKNIERDEDWWDNIHGGDLDNNEIVEETDKSIIEAITKSPAGE